MINTIFHIKTLIFFPINRPLWPTKGKDKKRDTYDVGKIVFLLI